MVQSLVGGRFGSPMTDIDRYLMPAIGLVVVVSMLPIVCEVFRARRARRHGGAAR